MKKKKTAIGAEIGFRYLLPFRRLVIGILLAAVIKFRLSFEAPFDSSLMYANYTRSTPKYQRYNHDD